MHMKIYREFERIKEEETAVVAKEWRKFRETLLKPAKEVCAIRRVTPYL